MKLLQKINRRLLNLGEKGYPGREAVAENLRILSADRNVEETLESFYGKKLKTLVQVTLAGLLLTAAMAICECGNSLPENGYFLPRRDNAYTQELWVIPGPDSGKEKEVITVEIEPRGMTPEQIKKLLSEETGRMESYILGENSSLEEVRTDLKLIREIEGTPITVDWELDSYEVLNLDGSIRKEKVTEEGTIVGIRGRLRCEGQERVYEAAVRVLPELQSPEEQWKKALAEEMESLRAQSRLSEREELPKAVEGISLSWKEKKNSTVIFFPVLTGLCLILVYMARDQELKNRCRSGNGSCGGITRRW